MKVMKIKPAFLVAFNFLARAVGILAILGGIAFLLCAYLIVEDRWVYAVIGVFQIVVGIALNFAKSVKQEDLDKMQRFVNRN